MGSVWTEREAAHLLRRAGFAAPADDVRASVTLGRKETVRRLVAGQRIADAGAKAAALAPLEELQADGKPLKADDIGDQQLYWLYRMANTDAPLAEKMTLFWHGHLTSSYRKVKDVAMMVKQNELFRSHALGNFKELMLVVGQDPAMMLWLDVNSNRKGKPNENYAREVMELFTLGIGHYTEQDIREAARAFTGWHVDRSSGEASYQPKQHDNGTKTILGETGAFDAKGVVDVLFEQKALPQFLARKLLRFFATDTPSDDWVEAVAADVSAQPTIGGVLEKLFNSDAFYDDAVQQCLVKTPAEYVAGWMRSLPLPLTRGYNAAMRKMGQELYMPPNVAGWTGGTSWLLSSWLLARYQFAESAAFRMNAAALTSPEFTPADKSSADAWLRQWSDRLGIGQLGPATSAALAAYAEDTFLHAKQTNTNGLRGFLHLLMVSPEAQMK
ncbi:hypothetical protein SD70_04480 [Gordoniibacillus kamchatkensis]|uniref:DUF1800 domain-containing protein n=1 Tax=Gordoniibacillus kamchatkensis TaxID=1590651 RepID=A0ABR5ALY0_9BACL|nr:DUF1800 domain-containing protein [Paenibacillus sp. VKM B-2647]KIL41873.1 hypothetical protein SD70_04480 [Paenibacillus sp. VKM B-2647]